MKKLIIKTALFVVPFFLLFTFYCLFYDNQKGDLFRIGYLFQNDSYNKDLLFKDAILKKKCYKYISEIDLSKNHKSDFFVIGDSFSEMGNVGYKNYLGYFYNKSVIQSDRFVSENPIEGLYNLINSDFFDHIKTDYVILQNVEREVADRSINLNRNNALSIDSLNKYIDKRIAKHEEKESHQKKDKKITDKFFSRDIIRFPMYNFNFMFDDNAFVSDVYKIKLNASLFSANTNDLLCFKDDIKVLKLNNDLNCIKTINDVFNDLAMKLKQKNIKLIVMVSPDKYDIYYDYFLDKAKYEKPTFYTTFSTMKKDYIYIDSKTVLGNAIKKEKDIYYFDDSHWSPKASKLIADEIIKMSK